jgi:hypothetical protein
MHSKRIKKLTIRPLYYFLKKMYMKTLTEIDRFLALWAVGHDDWCTKRTKALSNPSERQLTVTAVSVSECRQAS